MLNKISRETLADQAARNLMAYIEAEDLKPGRWLPSEHQLAADLGVSRPIIREALKSLEGKGVIAVVSGKGAVVKPLDGQLLQQFFQRAIQIEQEALIDLIELRRAIEIAVAGQAARQRRPEELAQIAAIVGEMRRSLHAPEDYVALDVTFHQLVAALTRNQLMCHLVTSIREVIKDTLQESQLRSLNDEQLERVQRGHEAILAAIEQGDVAAAEQAMAEHFEEAINSLVSRTRSAEGS